MRKATRSYALAVLMTVGSLTAAVVGPSAEAGEPGAEPAAAPPGPVALPSLEAFLAAAATHAPSIRVSEATVDQREREHDHAVLGLLPVLRASASYTRNQYEASTAIPQADGSVVKVTITPEDQLVAEIRVDVTLLDAPAIRRIGAADSQREQARLDVADATLAARRDVLRAYYARVAAESVERAAERALEAARANAKVIATRLDAELATELDALRADAEVDRRIQDVGAAHRQVLLAGRKLESLTGLPPVGAAPELAPDLTPLGDVTPSRARVADLPAVRSADAGVDVASANATSSWLVLVPRINGFASERFTNASGFGQSPAWAVGLSAEWALDPAAIGQGRVDSAGVKVAQARRDQVVAAATDAFLDAEADVETLRLDALAARTEEATSKRAAQIAVAEWQAGKATALDVLLANRDAFQAEVARVQADANLELARALFDASFGRGAS